MLALLLPTAHSSAQGHVHVVQRGETLYALCQHYAVSLEAMQHSNPGLDIDHIRTGEKLMIPAFRCDHVVEKRQTLWSIAQMYGLTPEQLVQANPELNNPDHKLRKGVTLRIPYTSEQWAQMEAQFKPKRVGLDTVRLAVVLPLLSEGGEGKRVLEFYRGVLLAADALREDGRPVRITAYNEPPAGQGMYAIKTWLARERPHIVLGPLYPAHIAALGEWAAGRRDSWLVVPFSSKVPEVERSPRMVLLNAPQQQADEQSVRLLLGTFAPDAAQVVFVHTAEPDKAAQTVALRGQLLSKGYKIADIHINTSPQSALETLAAGKLNVMVPDASTAEVAEAVAEKLKAIRMLNPALRCALVGYEEWQQRGVLTSEQRREANVYIPVSHVYLPEQRETAALRQAYRRWWNADFMPVRPRMALLGYDAARALLAAMREYGDSWRGEKVGPASLTQEMRFAPLSQGEKSGMVCESLFYLHFSSETDGLEIIKNLD